jgi:hypothetical protein
LLNDETQSEKTDDGIATESCESYHGEIVRWPTAHTGAGTNSERVLPRFKLTTWEMVMNNKIKDGTLQVSGADSAVATPHSDQQT